MDNLIEIKKLNSSNCEISSPVYLKIFNSEKGRSVFLNSTDSVGTVAFVEFLPDGSCRGNHFHKTKREILYIIEGKLELYYWLPFQQDTKMTLLEDGHLITIKPGLSHAYKAIEKTLGFEMGSNVFNPEDTVSDLKIK